MSYIHTQFSWAGFQEEGAYNFVVKQTSCFCSVYLPYSSCLVFTLYGLVSTVCKIYTQRSIFWSLSKFPFFFLSSHFMYRMGWLENGERANSCFFPLSQELFSDLKGSGTNGLVVDVCQSRWTTAWVPSPWCLYVFSDYAKNQNPSYVSATVPLKNSLCTSADF